MFASNVLGRFLLTHQLLSLLERGAPARVLVVTGPSPDRLDFDDLVARIDFKPFRQSAPRTPPTCCSPSNWHAACRGRG